MRAYQFGILAVIVIGAWLSFPTDAHAATTLTSCQTISTSGDYILGNNVSSGGTCFSIRAANVTFNGNGKTITVSSGDAVEVAYYGSGTAAHHVTVSNVHSNSGVRTYGDPIHHVTFTNLNVSGITVYGSDDVTINGNTVGSDGISISNADATSGWYPLRPVVTNNTITGPIGHTTKILLELVGGKYHPCPRIDAIMTNNTINNYRNDNPAEANASVRIRCATHTTFTDNTIQSTGTTIGLYMRDESDDGVYEDNIFRTNSHEAIRIASGNEDKTFPSRNIFQRNQFISSTGQATFIQGMGSDNQFRNNLFWSAQTGLIDGADGNLYDHNTFYVTGSGESIQTFNYDHGPTDTWTNNIFSYAGATTVYGFDGFTTDRYAAHHNLFHNRSGVVAFFNYGSLSAWKSSTGDDASSFEANPLFTDPTNGDFSLQAGSPARNQASDGTNIGYDGTAAIMTPPSSPSTNTGPTIKILSPTSRRILGGIVLLHVKATDADGVAKVRFFVDGEFVGEDTTAPFRRSFNTRPLRNGKHAITFEAIDTKGAVTTRAHSMKVRNPFTIRLSVSWPYARVSGTIALRPRFINGGSAITVVEYFIDKRRFASTTAEPYTATWDTTSVANGRHRVTIRAIDARGRKATHTVYFRVLN